MYSKLPNLVIGFHGCDISTYEEVLYKHIPLKPSENDYDWLGPGIYFWEQNLERAWLWAKEAINRKNSKIKTPAVIGAVINLGYCLDLLDFANLQLLRSTYEAMQSTSNIADFLENKSIGGMGDLLLRELDCAVIESLHTMKEDSHQSPFDSIRGIFSEGEELYPNAGFREKDHIQICVRNPNCIKGFFLPRKLDFDYPKV